MPQSPEAKARKRERERVWVAQNREHVREYHRRWIEENREHHSAYQRDYYHRNKDRLRESRHRARLKHRYGLTDAEIDALFKVRVCAICGSGERLCVDHCHDSGRVRGLLCSNCNTGIARLQDDPALLRKAARYLSK